MDKSEEASYRQSVIRAHNIEITEDGFMCNDGDVFTNVWEALEHTIWLDLITKEIKDKNTKRHCNDYYEILNESPSHESIEEEKVD